LIRAIVSPYDDQADGEDTRVVIRGPDVSVAANAVTSLALLVHEFSSNAAKYGALSTATGRIEISCAADDGQVATTWRERGGPADNNEIGREGFGSLLARMTVGQLGGNFSREWTPEGLTIRLSVDRSRISA